MKKSKKFFSPVLSILLILSFAVPVFAMPPGKGQDARKNIVREPKIHAVQNAFQKSEQNTGLQVVIQNVYQESDQNQFGVTVTENVYGHQGLHIGVENALKRVKNPVARAALQAILEGQSVSQAVYNARQSLIGVSDINDVLDAAEQLQEAVDENVYTDLSTKALTYRYLGEMFLQAGKITSALSALETAVKCNPADDQNYIELNNLFSKAGDYKVKVFVKGTMPAFDVSPRMENGRVLVPLRALAESLGTSVSYDNGTINIKEGNMTIKLTVGDRRAYVNGKPVLLDVPATVTDGRTLVPLRFIGEGFNIKVDYYGGSNLVVLKGK